ncbi:MAG TPA: hypothetical protein VK071_12540 [Tissierellales bacterium]|nr:hypothetical protein [Tissierellales bacterium]
MYDILIVGHGEFATGMKSSLDILIGKNDRVHAQNLNEEITHNEFEEIIDTYIKKYDKLVVFADLSGGAPCQIVSRRLLTLKKSPNQYVISGMPLSMMLDLSMKLLFMEEQKGDISNEIEESMEQSKDMMQVLSTKEFIEGCDDN